MACSLMAWGLAAPALAGNYVQVSAPGGSTTVILNLQSGVITNCPAYQSTAGQPLSACKNIGTLNVAGVAGTASNVAITFPNASNATLTNLTNGSVARCSMLLNGLSGAVQGTCSPDHAF